MVRVDKHRGRRTSSADLFQNLAIGDLRKSVTAKFLRGGHSKNTNPAQPVDHISRNVSLSVDLGWIELSIQHLSQRSQRFIQLSLLRGGHSRVGHHPVRNETAEEKSLGKSKCFRSAQKQLFRLLNLFLSLRFRLSHCHR